MVPPSDWIKLASAKAMGSLLIFLNHRYNIKNSDICFADIPTTRSRIE
jgi:hypothetical protein